MGVALGWMALALAAVAGAPDGGRGGVPIKYNIRILEADGLEWRQGVINRMTPVTRQGAATVWTAPRDVEKTLLRSDRITRTGGLCASDVVAWSGSPIHVRTQEKRQIVTQAAWTGEGGTIATRPENLGVGSATTMTGRKLDQGILVQMVFKDAKVVAVHRVSLDGPTTKSASSDPAARAAAYHAAACEATPRCQNAGSATTGSSTEPAPIQTEFPWSDLGMPIVPNAGSRRTTANVNPKRMPLARQVARLTRKLAKKRGVEILVVEATAPTPDSDSDCSEAPDAECYCPAETQKVAIEVPEIDSQEIAGEWLIPNDGILLVSFGPHTIADKNGKAVIRERLAIIAAEETASPPASYFGQATAVVSPSHSPTLASPSWSFRAAPAPAAAGAPLAEAPATSIPAPMPVPAAPVPPMPPVPNRSIPQGYHKDGKAAELPPLPADEADDDDDSSEPRPSPQSRKPRPADKEPAAKPEAKATKPAGDTAARKAQFSVEDIPGIPAVFRSAPGVGLQFLLPIKPVSLKLPFDRRLEIEIYGRVIRSPQTPRDSAEIAARPARSGTTTK